jgi:hypothetical protein
MSKISMAPRVRSIVDCEYSDILALVTRAIKSETLACTASARDGAWLLEHHSIIGPPRTVKYDGEAV